MFDLVQAFAVQVGTHGECVHQQRLLAMGFPFHKLKHRVDDVLGVLGPHQLVGLDLGVGWG